MSFGMGYDRQPQFSRIPSSLLRVNGRAQEAELGSVQSLLGKFVCKYPFTQYHGMDPEVPGVKEVTLENHLGGTIIGYKGARISDIRRTTGASIKIG